MLYHPRTLELLLKYKRGHGGPPPAALLALILDHTVHIDIDAVFRIIFSFTRGCTVQDLADLVRAGFMQTRAQGLPVCHCRHVPDGVRELIRQKRAGPPETVSDGRAAGGLNFIEELPAAEEYGGTGQDCPAIGEAGATDEKGNEASRPHEPSLGSDTREPARPAGARKRAKAPAQSNVLSFERTEIRPANASTGRFQPLELKSAIFVYDRNNIVLDTVRKRDDLVSPVRLQFIKLCDQRRPPIYRKRERGVRARRSYERLSEIISYDECSSEDWGTEDGDAVTCGSITDSEESDTASSEQAEEQWIEADSDEVEDLGATRFNKKPTFCFDKINIEVFFKEDAYLGEPLREDPGACQDASGEPAPAWDADHQLNAFN